MSQQSNAEVEQTDEMRALEVEVTKPEEADDESG